MPRRAMRATLVAWRQHRQRPLRTSRRLCAGTRGVACGGRSWSTGRVRWPRSRSSRSVSAGCCTSWAPRPRAIRSGAPRSRCWPRSWRSRSPTRSSSTTTWASTRSRWSRWSGRWRSGEELAGAVIGLMFSGGAALEAAASQRARRELTALVQRAPEGRASARRRARCEDVPVDAVQAGDVVVVRTGRGDPGRRHGRQRRGGGRHEHAQRRAAAGHAALRACR